MTAFLLALLLSISEPTKARPHAVRMRVVVSRGAQDILVEIDNGEYYRSAQQQTDGDRLTYWFEFRDVPSGTLFATASERLRDGRILRTPPREFYIR